MCLIFCVLCLFMGCPHPRPLSQGRWVPFSQKQCNCFFFLPPCFFTAPNPSSFYSIDNRKSIIGNHPPVCQKSCSRRVGIFNMGVSSVYIMYILDCLCFVPLCYATATFDRQLEIDNRKSIYTLAHLFSRPYQRQKYVKNHE
jgi:hypothetical protein